MLKHEFNKGGIERFIERSCNVAMASGKPIVLSVGFNEIRIPTTPEAFESMEKFLWFALEIWEEEYK